jgi:hypothetical protein
MTLKSTPSPSTSPALAEYLADREGLSGSARKKFLLFLRESLGFHISARPGSWRTLLTVAVLASLIGPVLDDWVGSAQWQLWIWCGYTLLGAGLALVLRSAERRTIAVDRETYWRIYCLLFRPILMSEKPGLVDRNQIDDRSAHERLAIRPMLSLRTMLCEGSVDLWWSSILGLWSGMLGLLVAKVCLAPVSLGWAIGLPLGGIVLGPVSCVYGQRAAFLWVLRVGRI